MASDTVAPKNDIVYICPAIERLSPRVISLIYWKKPVESAIVMATGFTLLFSIGCLSLISVFAYVCLAILCCTGAARVYYDLITSKRDETASPPFSDWFIKDKEALRQRVHDYVNEKFDKTESTFQDLRHYLLIENYIDSLKAIRSTHVSPVNSGWLLQFDHPRSSRLYADLHDPDDLRLVQIDKFTEKPKREWRKIWSKAKAQFEKIPYLKKEKQN
ncbi:Reticulon-4 [Echinococcus granulosus]|uniref:Reticulon-like protein n=1 Tax=Echinococcus granulosus TaxID=6210 RepID=W6UHC6_ECHGR|nr:Reticulon-4 [Echinococcus granulosus]EUB60463.1 Reticulon-4 [Echinococcus granulosus]